MADTCKRTIFPPWILSALGHGENLSLQTLTVQDPEMLLSTSKVLLYF